MAFGALQRSKSYRQLWVRPVTRTPPLGRGAASLVLGADSYDETATLQSGDSITVETTGLVNDAKRLEVRGVARLNAPPPEGYGWRVTMTAGPFTQTLDFTETVFGDLNYPVEFSLSDLALNVAGLAGVVTVGFGLELILDPADPGFPATDVEVVLPSVFIDELRAPEVLASELYVADRFPAPGQTNVPNSNLTIVFRLADTNGAGVDLANTAVTVDGVAVYAAGAFISPWSGTATAGTGPTGNDVTFELTPPASFLPLDSEQSVEINVVSQLNGPLSPIDTTWAWVAADTIAPAVQTAAMISKNTLRVGFTDDVLMDSSANGALNPANYSTVRISVPAVTLSVVSVAQVPGSTREVDVTFNWEASMGAIYTIIAANVVDDGGNAIMPVGQELRFTGYVPPRPRGRRFELLDFIPDMNIAEDRTAAQGADANNPGTGELRKFILVLQDVVDILLCQVDRWTEIFDVDLAEEQFLDAILQDLGNPFADCISDLDVAGKRRLARVLISIYKQKGTEVGVINAVRFFLGLEVTLDVINDRAFWQLNVSTLDVNTILAPPVGSPLWYSFYVVSPVVLTDEQQSRILCIADYMKAAHEHILGIIEPGNVIAPSDYWILNVSLLGSASPPSTTLA